MATVRITDSLRAEVRRKIDHQFTTREDPINQATTNLLNGSREFTDAVVGALCDTYGITERDLEKVKPFLVHASRINIESINDVPIPWRWRAVSLQRAIPWATQGPTHNKLSSPRLAHWATELKKQNDQREQLDAEKRKFVSQVDMLLEKCGTYRQAVEIWPQLTSVTPQHIIDRHNAPTTRAKPTKPNVSLDTDSLNVTAVVNTIADRNNGCD